jgi:hypothetical protein
MSINAINMNMKKSDMKKSDMKSDNRVPHPCPNCSKMCLGKQCSDCHLKMVEKSQGECGDCKKQFFAIRPDGTRRKRCKECQDKYNETHIAICKGCTKTYHAVLEDGRKFDKCFECYQKSMSTTCETCNGKSFGQKFCKPCYEVAKNKKFESKQTNDRPLKKCATKSCAKQTTYRLCRDCNYTYKTTADSYMISSCGDCGIKYRGDYRFCKDCSRKSFDSR